MMKHIEVDRLAEEIAEGVALVQAGERVCITDKGRVVAELVGPTPDASDKEARAGEEEPPDWHDSPLADLIRQGVVTPARAKGRPPRPADRSLSISEIVAALDRDREDRW